jgi:hypothetical protein
VYSCAHTHSLATAITRTYTTQDAGDGWCEGSINGGATGVIPASYIQFEEGGGRFRDTENTTTPIYSEAIASAALASAAIVAAKSKKPLVTRKTTAAATGTSVANAGAGTVVASDAGHGDSLSSIGGVVSNAGDMAGGVRPHASSPAAATEDGDEIIAVQPKQVVPVPLPQSPSSSSSSPPASGNDHEGTDSDISGSSDSTGKKKKKTKKKKKKKKKESEKIRTKREQLQWEIKLLGARLRRRFDLKGEFDDVIDKVPTVQVNDDGDAVALGILFGSRTYYCKQNKEVLPHGSTGQHFF